MKHKLAKILKESFRWGSDEQFSFKYFLYIAFVREISLKLSGSFGQYRHEWVNPLMPRVINEVVWSVILLKMYLPIIQLNCTHGALTAT